MALAVACSALASGCGGGSGTSGATGATRAGGSAPATATPTTTGGSPATTQTQTSSPTALATTPSAASGGQPTIAAANAICARRNRELQAVSDASANLHVLATAARKRAAVEERALGELEKLTPPADLAARYRDLIAFDQAALLRVVKLGERALAGDAAGARIAEVQVGAKRLRLLALMIHTGLRDCAAIG